MHFCHYKCVKSNTLFNKKGLRLNTELQQLNSADDKWENFPFYIFDLFITFCCRSGWLDSRSDRWSCNKWYNQWNPQARRSEESQRMANISCIIGVCVCVYLNVQHPDICLPIHLVAFHIQRQREGDRTNMENKTPLLSTDWRTIDWQINWICCKSIKAFISVIVHFYSPNSFNRSLVRSFAPFSRSSVLCPCFVRLSIEVVDCVG